MDNNVKNLDAPSWRSSYTQMIAACVIHLLVIQAGINMALSAVLLPQLQRTDSDIKLTSSEASWIASLVTITLPIGSLLSGPLMDRYGRRNMAMVICILYVTSWIFIFWADDVTWLYIGRIVAGATAGMSNVAIFYTSETTHPLWRPMLLGLNSVFVSFGILLTAILGVLFYWRTMAVIFAAMTVLIFISITTLPESPHWFLSFKKGAKDTFRMEQAKKSLQWFNRRSSIAEKEFQCLLNVYRFKDQVSFEQKQESMWMQKLWYFKEPECFRPMTVLIILFLFQQLSGSYVIVFYAVDIFDKLGFHSGLVDQYTAMVFLGVIRFVTTIVSMILSRRFGRRVLCMMSGIGMSLSLILAWACVQIKSSESKIVLLVCVLAYVCSGAIGWQVIPWALTGELLPTRIRATGGGILISYTYVIMFVMVKNYPFITLLLGIDGMFLFFGIVSLTSTVYVWKFLPETLGKTLEQIENSFK